MTADYSLALAARAWPFEEARKLVERVGGKTPAKGYVLFETGYGPSGLPHIGTFGEVARTTMVRQAFQRMSDIPTKLIAFSDDMDGLRKVPSNLPNQDMLRQYLEMPVTKIPDPFGTHESFGHHNNARLRAFLDQFGFDYEFRSSTACYASGMFDETLLKVLRNYDAIQKIMLPSLRAERQATYSPFLPISPKTGKVLQVPMEELRPDKGTIVYRDPESGALTETLVTGGHCKLQWKPDWAMHWVAFDVDYEMAGKDLIDSVKLSGAIVRALGGTPPEGFNYELFLDENGQKISKSKGNGLTIEEWLTYASPESLAQFMFQKPSAAKRLYFDVIPRTVDEYLGFLDRYPSQAWKERLGNPVWHIHNGQPPEAEVLHHPGEGDAHGTSVSFGMLLNLAAVANSEDAGVLWGFLRRYAPGASPENHPRLDRLVGYAVAYFRDFVRLKKAYRLPDDVERGALEQIADVLGDEASIAWLLDGDLAANVQTRLYDIARKIPRYQDFKAKTATPERPGVSNEFFNALYQVLLGEDRGPRFGSFVALYGIPETKQLIADALAGDLKARHDAFMETREKKKA